MPAVLVVETSSARRTQLIVRNTDLELRPSICSAMSLRISITRSSSDSPAFDTRSTCFPGASDVRITRPRSTDASMTLVVYVDL